MIPFVKNDGRDGLVLLRDLSGRFAASRKQNLIEARASKAPETETNEAEAQQVGIGRRLLDDVLLVLEALVRQLERVVRDVDLFPADQLPVVAVRRPVPGIELIGRAHALGAVGEVVAQS